MLCPILAALALCLPSGGLPFLAPVQAPAADSGAAAGRRGDPVLRIGEEEVSREEYAGWLLENYGARLATEFAGDHLIQREAVRRGVVLEPDLVVRELESELEARISGAFLGSKAAWLAELERTQRTEAGIRAQRTQQLGIELLTKKCVAQDRVVPEHKIVREWELDHGRGGRRYELSMLLVKCEFLTVAEVREAQERAREEEMDRKRARALELKQRIEAGAEFAAVARESSDDAPTRARGGRLAQPFRQFGWPTNFLDALDRLEVGRLSEPLYAKGGFWLVRVESVVSTPLESVRGELVARLTARGPEQDETGNFRNALVEAASVTVLPTMFSTAGGDLEQSMLQPALSIDGEPVSRGEYAGWIQRTRGEASLAHFLEHRVVFDEARRRGIGATEEEVRARSEEYVRRLILESHEGDREAWLASLKIRGNDLGLFMHDLDVRMRVELLCERLMLLDRKLSPEAVRARFEDLYGKDGVAARVRMILVNVKPPAGPAEESREAFAQRLNEAKAAARARAQALVAAVRDGGDFAALARKESDEPISASRGGMLEGRFRPETWPEAVGKAVAGLAAGGTSDALEYGPTFVVLQVVSREAVQFESVREDLAAQMQQEPPPRPELNLYRNQLVQRTQFEVLGGMHR